MTDSPVKGKPISAAWGQRVEGLASRDFQGPNCGSNDNGHWYAGDHQWRGELRFNNPSGSNDIAIPAFGVFPLHFSLASSNYIHRDNRDFTVASAGYSSSADWYARQQYAVNGPRAVDMGDSGECYTALERPRPCLYDATMDSDPPQGCVCGLIPETESATSHGFNGKLYPGLPGFTLWARGTTAVEKYSGSPGGEKVVYALQDQHATFWGRVTADHADTLPTSSAWIDSEWTDYYNETDGSVDAVTVNPVYLDTAGDNALMIYDGSVQVNPYGTQNTWPDIELQVLLPRSPMKESNLFEGQLIPIKRDAINSNPSGDHQSIGVNTRYTIADMRHLDAMTGTVYPYVGELDPFTDRPPYGWSWLHASSVKDASGMPGSGDASERNLSGIKTGAPVGYAAYGDKYGGSYATYSDGVGGALYASPAYHYPYRDPYYVVGYLVRTGAG